MYFTERQLKLLTWLHGQLQATGVAPTLEEIAAHFGIAKVTALQHLRALEKKGSIRRKRYQRRSIELQWEPKREPPRATQLPIAGRLQADGRLDYLPRPPTFDPLDLVPTERHGHVVRVVGDHLAAEGFPDGALLVIEPRGAARPGEIVLARVADGRVLLRRLEKSAVDDALVPLSGAAPDRSNVLPARRATLLGVVRAQVIRYGEGR